METSQLLSAIVAINSAFPGDSPAPDRPGERALGGFLADFLRAEGFRVERQEVRDGRANVLAEEGSDGHTLLLTGHMDTGPRVAGWTKTGPWTPLVQGDRLYGLGACDMKGGLVAILQAVRGFAPDGYTLKVAFVVDEENVSEGAYVLGESGWLGDVEAVLVPEGPQPREPGEDYAAHPNVLTLGRRGRIDIDVTLIGRPGHAAHPERGVSALRRGAVLALALGLLAPEKHTQLKRGGATIRRFVSEAAGLSIPEVAQLRIDRHLVPPETPASAQLQVEELIERLYQEGALERATDMPIEVAVPARHPPYLLPYVTSPEEPVVRLVEAVVRERFGDARHDYGMSVADENYYGAALGLPVVVLGPVGDNAHAADEWVSLSSVEELADVYRTVLD